METFSVDQWIEFFASCRADLGRHARHRMVAPRGDDRTAPYGLAAKAAPVVRRWERGPQREVATAPDVARAADVAAA